MNNRRRRHAKRIRKMGGVRGQHPSGIVRGIMRDVFTVSEQHILNEFERMGIIERVKK